MQVLLDVGAGNGYFSLAAAARGHDVIAFELSNTSLASFEASAKYNGFQKAITLHKVSSPSPGMLPSTSSEVSNNLPAPSQPEELHLAAECHQHGLL